jgi:DNA-binding transcriptional LysR family regulator
MAWDARIRRRLKLRDLDTLLAVAQWGSMAKAAAHLAVSQPAVSNAIADLEHTLGVRLFDRTAQGVEATLYGSALAKWAVAVFDDVRQGVKEIEYLLDSATGEFRVGTSEPMIVGLLPAVFDRLSARHPGITCRVTQASGIARLYRELRERRVDLVLGRVVMSEAKDDLATEILFDDPLFVVAGANNPWTRRRKIKLSELTDEPWALPRSDTLVGSHMLAALEASGRAGPPAGLICNSVQMRIAMLASGRFLATLPRSVLQYGAKQMAVKVLPVELPRQATESVGLITLRNRTMSPVAQLFIDCVREVAKPLAEYARSRASPA